MYAFRGVFAAGGAGAAATGVIHTVAYFHSLSSYIFFFCLLNSTAVTYAMSLHAASVACFVRVIVAVVVCPRLRKGYSVLILCCRRDVPFGRHLHHRLIILRSDGGFHVLVHGFVMPVFFPIRAQ